MRNALLLALLLASACKQNKSKLDDMLAQKSVSGTTGGSAASDAKAIDIDTKDILNRKESASSVQVKHVLLAWKDLDKVYQGRMDPRAQKRTNEEAAKLAQDIASQLR